MENGFESWSLEPPNPNLSSARIGFGPQLVPPSFANTVSRHVQQEPCGWFYGLPRYRHGLLPVVNSNVKEVKQKLSGTTPDTARETNGVQKKFLVFDQSGDQTTLIYSSGVDPSSNFSKPQFAPHAVDVNVFAKENDSKSETLEDTEELNALLYSDDDYDNDTDDERSTGHSPSSVTGKREMEEEVASSGGSAKRRKRDDRGNTVNEHADTASSGESGTNCCGNGVFSVSYGNKRMRKEKIKETMDLLQNVIPGDKIGKDAIMVIDEAIHYLRTLKVKAKALGLDSL